MGPGVAVASRTSEDCLGSGPRLRAAAQEVSAEDATRAAPGCAGKSTFGSWSSQPCPRLALRRDLAGDPSRSKFRSRLRESVWTRLSRSAELTRLTGRLRCGCAGWEWGGGGSSGTSRLPPRTRSRTPGGSVSEGQEIDLPEIPPIPPPTLLKVKPAPSVCGNPVSRASARLCQVPKVQRASTPHEGLEHQSSGH